MSQLIVSPAQLIYPLLFMIVVVVLTAGALVAAPVKRVETVLGYRFR